MQNRSFLALALAGVMAMWGNAGCSKREEAKVAPPPAPENVVIVQEKERSRHFLAVSRQLELGGSLYGYVDVDGDVLKLTGSLKGILESAAQAQPQLAGFAQKDYAGIAELLGLTGVKALGVSSVPDGTGFFRNRTFFYTPGGRKGLLAGLGGASGGFVRVALAPENTDFYHESEIDLPAMYAALHDAVVQIAGDQTAQTWEAQLKRSSGQAAFSLYAFIHGLKGRAVTIARFEGEKTMTLPGKPPLVVPMCSLLISLEGVAPSLEPMLQKLDMLTRREEGAVTYYSLKQPPPLPGLNPVIAVEGNTIYLTTSPEFMNECLGKKTVSLADRAEFKESLAKVGTQGNGLSYISPAFFKQLRRVESLNPRMPEDTKKTLRFVSAMLPQTDRPLVSVRRNLPDGILVQSYWDRSLKQDVAMMAGGNPVTIGLLAAMAIPAFQKVRDSSQEKAVMNNLRQLAAASDQYYLENGATTVRFDQLVGPERTKYIKRMIPVGGEDYTKITFRVNAPLEVYVPALKKKVIYPNR